MWEQRLNGSLSESDREKIWLLFDEGSANMTQLAQRFGVSVATISRELQNRRQRTNIRTPARAKAATQPA
jgi:IS30 family transposase